MTKALGKEGSFAEGPSNSPRQRFFWKKILTISLPRAREQALGKGLKKFKKTISLPRASPRKRILKNPENFFAEGQGGGPRQRFFFKNKKIYLPRVGPRQTNSKKTISLPRAVLALGKGFAECPIKGPRQRPLRRLKIPRGSLPRAALGKAFAEGFWA